MAGLVVYSRLDGSEAQWLEIGRSGAPIGGVRDGMPAPPAQRRGPVPCVWILRGEDVVLTRAELAVRGAAEIQRALPYLLEEELAGDVDALIFAYRREAGRLLVIAADAARLAQGRAALAAVGLRPRRILPDVLLLPFQAGSWALAYAPGRVLVRLGAADGFVCEPDSLDWSLARAWQDTPEAERPERLLVSGAGPDTPVGPVRPAPEGQLEIVNVAGELLPRLAEAVDKATGPELNPGPERSTVDRGSRWRWGLAAGLALLAVGLSTAALWWEGRELAAGNRAAQMQIDAVFKRSFPGRRIQDAHLQMQQEIAALERAGSGKGGFLPLVQALAAPFVAEKQLHIERIEYRKGQLALSLRGRDVAQLERLKQALERSVARPVEIGSVQAGADHVKAQLRVRPGAA